MGLAKSLSRVNYLQGLANSLSEIGNMLREQKKKEEQLKMLSYIADQYKKAQENLGNIRNRQYELLPGANIDIMSPNNITDYKSRLGTDIPALSNERLLLSPEVRDKVMGNQFLIEPEAPASKTREITPLEKYIEAQNVANQFASDLFSKLLTSEYADNEILQKANIFNTLLSQNAERFKPQKMTFQQFDPEKDTYRVDEYGNIEKVIQSKPKKDFDALGADEKGVWIFDKNTGEIKYVPNEYYEELLEIQSGYVGRSGGGGGRSSDYSASDGKNKINAEKLAEKRAEFGAMPIYENTGEGLVEAHPAIIRKKSMETAYNILYSNVRDNELLAEIHHLIDQYGGRFLSPQEFRTELEIDDPEKSSKKYTAEQLQQLEGFLAQYENSFYKSAPFHFNQTQKGYENYLTEYYKKWGDRGIGTDPTQLRSGKVVKDVNK